MIKKIICVLSLTVLVTGGAFAQIKSSYGFGGFFSQSFGGGHEITVPKIDAAGADITRMEFSLNGYGIFGFYDINYLEASIGFTFGTLARNYIINKANESRDFADYNLTGGIIGAYLKYPFTLKNKKLTLYPIAGAEYQWIFSLRPKETSTTSPDLTFGHVDDPELRREIKANDLSCFWVKFGLGLDYPTSEKMFIRGVFLYGIRFASKLEKELRSQEALFLGGNGKAVIGHGFQIRVSIGWK